jgi:hypothetical protein
MPSLHEQYWAYTIEQLLQALEVNAEPGSSHRLYLENLLSFRTAEMVNRQLAETARVTGVSANTIKETLEVATGDLRKASAQGVVATQQSAALIRESIGNLTNALQHASTDLRAASNQSAELGRRLNWLTGVLVAAALISAAATSFYAWETKRQVELAGQQLRRSQLPPQLSPNSPAAPTPKP